MMEHLQIVIIVITIIAVTFIIGVLKVTFNASLVLAFDALFLFSTFLLPLFTIRALIPLLIFLIILSFIFLYPPLPLIIFIF